ncbi:hypothetical protein AQ610_30065 [Burkholderia humptydooensis]|nr:hypothetical protein AQ610_30065 [Burkholderia humptydooensis]
MPRRSRDGSAIRRPDARRRPRGEAGGANPKADRVLPAILPHGDPMIPLPGELPKRSPAGIAIP